MAASQSQLEDLQSNLRVMPPTSVPVEFIGEGSANIVVRMQGPPEFYQEKLVRFQKNRPSNESYPNHVLYKFWNGEVKPQMLAHATSKHLDDAKFVGMELLRIDSTIIYDRLNEFLSQYEAAGRREKRFVGHRIAKAETALLIEDISVAPEAGWLHEFKPKWLAQSPSAPATALRCRNCAVQLQRYSEIRSNKAASAAASFAWHMCPLFFVNPLDNHASNGGRTYIPLRSADCANSEARYDVLQQWSRTPLAASIFASLKALQKHHGRHNLLDGTELDDTAAADLATAMTYRDCSVYLRASRTENGVLNVGTKLADFDCKNAAQKLDRWREMEQGLQEWYVAPTAGLPDEMPPCRLALDGSTVSDEAVARLYERPRFGGRSEESSVRAGDVLFDE